MEILSQPKSVFGTLEITMHIPQPWLRGLTVSDIWLWKSTLPVRTLTSFPALKTSSWQEKSHKSFKTSFLLKLPYFPQLSAI